MSCSILMANNVTGRLEGKVALITGGASGIGEATTRLFVRQGAKVLVADIQDELGHALCEELGSEETISYVHCDVTCEPDVQNAVDLAVSKHGKLDIMYNNAGVSGKPIQSILETDGEELKRVFDVNLFAGFYGAKHAARVMIPGRKGVILFTSSVASVAFDEIPHAYVASKCAVVGLTKNLCVELGKYGIRVNCISPFGVVTPLLMNCLGMDKKATEELVYSAGVLKEVVPGPEDIAEAALYLASDEAKYVTGVNFVVDGGYNLTNPTFSRNIRGQIIIG